MISYLKSAGCMASFSSHISFTVHMVIETKTTCGCKASLKLLQVLDWLSWAFSRQAVASYLLQRFYWQFWRFDFNFFPALSFTQLSVSAELMKTFIFHSLSICIRCFGEVTKFLLSQLVLLFIALVLVSCTFLPSLFLSLEVVFFCFVLLCCCFCGLMFCLIIQLSLLI